jgi:hypothetical protein
MGSCNISYLAFTYIGMIMEHETDEITDPDTENRTIRRELRLTPTEDQAYRKEARQNGIGVSTLVRMVMAKFLQLGKGNR